MTEENQCVYVEGAPASKKRVADQQLLYLGFLRIVLILLSTIEMRWRPSWSTLYVKLCLFISAS